MESTRHQTTETDTNKPPALSVEQFVRGAVPKVLMRLAFSGCRADELQRLTQGAVMDAWRSLQAGSKETPESILQHSIEQVEKKAASSRITFGQTAAFSGFVDETLSATATIKADSHTTLLEALESLPAQQCRIAKAYFCAGQSCQKIAKKENLPPDQLRALLIRARLHIDAKLS